MSWLLWFTWFTVAIRLRRSARIAGRWYDFIRHPARRSRYARVGYQLVPVVAGGVRGFSGANVFGTGFEGASVAPTLYGSTIVQSNDFETAPATVDYFHSIGTEALGTLAAWSQSVGAWSIASNVVTQTGANGAITTGHADWGDSTFFARVKWVTGSFPRVLFHSDAAAGQSVIVGSVDGTTMYLDKYVNPTYSTVSSVAAALTNGNFYWFKIQGSGTTYTLTLYNDSAGAIGTQVATTSGTIADAALQTGYIGFGSRSATQVTFGGAFANVCYVTGPAPTGWTTNVPTSWSNANEPAFCWSQKQAYYGSASLSIFHALAAVANTFWQGPASSALANGTSYQINGWAKVVNATGGLAIRDGLIGGFAITSTTSATWAPIGASYTGTGATVQMFAGPLGGGTGTVYFDYATIVQPTVPTGVLFNSLGAPLGGFTPTGTLAAWTQTGGAWSIASNVVSSPAADNSFLYSGHPDFWDGTLWMRAVAITGGAPGMIARTDGATTGYLADLNGAASLRILPRTGAGTYGAGVTAPCIINGGSWFWLKFTLAGSTLTATAYKDAGGYVGDQVATVSLTDSSYATGKWGLRVGGGIANTFGGNYPGTFLVQGPLPTGVTLADVAGEPAFCWSKNAPHGGTYAMSVYNNDAGATGDVLETFTAAAASYAAGAFIKATGAGTASLSLAGAGTQTVTQDNTWRQSASAVAALSAGASSVRMRMAGAGTAYFDDVYLDNAFALQLDDNVNTFIGKDGISVPPSQVITAQQAADRGRTYFVKRDTAPQHLVVNGTWADGGGKFWTDFAAAMLNRFLAPFDLGTGREFRSVVVEECPGKRIGGIRGSAEQYAFSAKMLTLETYSRSKAVELQRLFSNTFTVSPLTVNFTVPYNGTAEGEPTWQFTLVIPAGTTVTSVQLQNTVTGDTCTVSGLTLTNGTYYVLIDASGGGGEAYTPGNNSYGLLAINSNGFGVTVSGQGDTNFTGYPPTLREYRGGPPIGVVNNTMAATISATGGGSVGVTLDMVAPARYREA